MQRSLLFARSTRLALLASLGLCQADLGCSLGDVKHDACPSNDACALTFGPGSTCLQGFCTPAATCTSGHDCRRAAGGGACMGGVCVGKFPSDQSCTQDTEPPNLLSMRADGPNAPLVIGGIFSLAAKHDQALTDPIRLAVREINMNGGLNNGQQMGVVFCDNGGPMDMTTGTARAALDVHAFDYLAGTLGVPYIVGPLTSADALVIISELKKTQFPTVVISPSATSPTLSTTDANLNGTRMFWRTCPNDALQGKVLATQVIGANPMIKTVTIVYINDAYGGGLEAAFHAAFSGSVNLAPYDATTPMSPSALATLANTASSMGGDAVLVIAEHGSVAVQIIGALAGTSLGAKPFFLTDGSMDSDLLSTTAPAAVQMIVKNATGTAPADPSPTNNAYIAFNASLLASFQIGGTSESFLAQSYDATYVGAFGVVFASQQGSKYDGIDVAKGMAHLEAGTLVPIGQLDWPSGKGDLTTMGQIDVDGTSGPLQFDPTTGEAPGGILIWGVKPDLSGFTTINTVAP